MVNNVVRDAKAEFRTMMNSERNNRMLDKTENTFEPDFFHQMVFG